MPTTPKRISFLCMGWHGLCYKHESCHGAGVWCNIY